MLVVVPDFLEIKQTKHDAPGRGGYRSWWRSRDTFATSRSPKSSGVTTIGHNGLVPVLLHAIINVVAGLWCGYELMKLILLGEEWD